MEDIAVIGLGLRFPGEATSPEALWTVLEGAESQWSEFPKDRLNIDGYFHPSGDRQGSISFRGAHFLKGDIAAFDAPVGRLGSKACSFFMLTHRKFFSVAAEDAKAIDPQQRMLLEVSYEALENVAKCLHESSAGLRKEDLDGSDTAVYVGSFVKDYEQICLRDPDWAPRYAATGNGIAIMANRISYFFNFHGPSMTLDTGCSGSLVSVHLAAQSLRNGESSLAIAGGSGMILTPNTIMPMTALNFLSPDGKCYTFDARANGYGRGEGIGIIVMKRLSDALRDNDTIRAVIRGTAVNQDGRTPGITLPSKEAQVANITSVYAAAGLDFNQTAYVECHGTGTQAGDWRELKAVSETLGSIRSTENPIVVGSIKPNIGHLEGAAGVAGMIKGILVLEHGKIPPNINFASGNPDIDFESWKIKAIAHPCFLSVALLTLSLQVPRSVMDWPIDGTRRVSVNCFGFGGTNAHVIMDEAPLYLSSRGMTGNHSSLDAAAAFHGQFAAVEDVPGSESPPALQLFCYSSHEKTGVLRVMNSNLEFLEARKDDCTEGYLRDYAYTLNCRRSNLEWKGFVVADSLSDLASKVRDMDQAAVVRSSREKPPRLGFVFCGQGAQWATMGKDLLRFDAFRISVEEASNYMAAELRSSFDLMEELLKGETQSCISRPHISQPVTTALQIALVDLMSSFGIVPSHVVGHSSGEIAAAYASGALSKTAAWEVAYYRGLAAASIPSRAPKLQGAMMVVGMSQKQTEDYLAAVKKSAQIACINSPRSITISGQAEAIDSINKDLRSKKVFCRVLNVKTAYHSSHMKLVEHDYKEAISSISARECLDSVSMFSSVTGKLAHGADLDAAYWAANLVSPVQYVAAIQSMMDFPADQRPNVIVELSPRAALRSPTAEILSAMPGPQPTYHSALDPKVNGAASLLGLVGELWSQGISVKMDQVSGQSKLKCLTDLPPYPWNHTKSYWHESHLSVANRFREYGRQDLIGAPTADSVPFEPRWRGFLRVSENPWIQDHQVQKTIVYPAAGMVSMVLEGAMQMGRNKTDLLGYEITNMQIEKAMLIPNTAHGLEVAMNVKSSQDPTDSSQISEQNEFVIYSKPLGHDWERNASGSLHFRARSDDWDAHFQTHAAQHEALDKSCTETLNPRQLYEYLDTVGMNYGPLFQNMTEIRTGGNACISTVRVPDTKSKMPAKFEFPHLIHPATLDSMFQTLFAIDSSPMVPTFIKSLFVSASVNDSECSLFTGYATADRTGIRDAGANIVMKQTGTGQAHVVIEGLHLTGLSTPSPAEGGFLPNHRSLCTEIIWNQDATFARPSLFSEQIALLAHKYPALEVLQVGGGRSATLAALRILAPKQDETPRLARYTIVEPSGPDAVREALSHVKCTALEPFVEAKPDCSGLFADYHLVVVFGDSGVDADGLKKHLRAGGVLLKQRGTSEDADTNGRENSTPKDSGESFGIRFDNCDGPSVAMDVYRNPHPSKDATSAQGVVLLLPESPNAEACTFQHGMKQLVQQDYPDLAFSSVLADQLQPESIVGKVVISLLDFAATSAEGFSVFAWSESCFNVFNTLQKTAKGVIWITRGAHMKPLNPKGAPIIALARTLMSEDPLKTIVTFDLGFDSHLGDPSVMRNISSVFKQSFRTSSGSEPRETEYAEEGGRLYIPRLNTIASLNRLVEDDNFHGGFIQKPFYCDQAADSQQSGLKLAIAKPGIADGSMYYTEFSHPELAPDDVEIGFEKAPLTHLDLETVMGRTSESTIGMDIVGHVKRVGSSVTDFRVGDHVVALASSGTIQNSLRAKAQFVTSYQSAMTPSFYVSAYYAIIHVGRAGPGGKVLIHAGASSHGLAAIQIARSVGAEVFATVFGSESAQQRESLLGCGLSNDHIIAAESDSFVRTVQAGSKGKGVDVVYNPTLEHVEASFRCPPLSIPPDGILTLPGGTIVQFASKSPTSRASPTMGGSTTIVNLDLCQLMREDEAFVAEIFKRATNHVASPQFGSAPYPVGEHCFGIDRLEDALRQVQKTPYIGRATLTADAQSGSKVPVVNKNPTKPLSEALDKDGTYLLAGGLGGLGRSISELLISNGVRHLAYVSRSGESSGKAKTFIDDLGARGIDARAYGVDICDEAALAQVIRDRVTAEMPPIKGVFQCAAVIKDAVFDNMTYADWNSAIRPKTVGSWNLVHAIQAAGHDPAFVFLASSAGVIGSRGQANYAAGNCFEDALARYCRLRGKHAVAVDLGPVLGAGMLAEDEEILNMLRASGFYGIRHGDFLRVVEHAITGETTPGTLTPAQVVLGVGTGGLMRQNQPADPYWSRTALYKHLALVDMPPRDLAASGSAASVDAKTMLARCTDAAAAAGIVQAGLMGMLSKAMNMLPEELDANKPPNAYGVDSLVAVGVRNFVISSFGVEVSVFEVLSDATIAELAGAIAEKGGYGVDKA
ncbi:Polyketide synthase [Tolypocladium capitatum]|uniref:Polyketide synthase n=1 Tax=Tolypocladium capitatum TaxID=45235 RepID=A0A2K3QC20_9HYPO|nr:Polyketide synthase [Tolypocladium capitatum]